MSVEDVNCAINFMGMGFDSRPAPSASSAPLFGDASSQGTLAASLFKGVVNVDTVKVGQGTRKARFGMSPPMVTMGEREGIQPVCMFLTSASNINDNCLGCVGQKGEKFCTKRKQGIGELDTCGTLSHTKKVLIKVGHIHFWDHAKDQVYMVPLLAGTFSLAMTIYDLQGEALTQVQFNELVGLVKSQAVTTNEELFDVKDRILADSGVTFTPRK
jgi:hypothetical protein